MRYAIVTQGKVENIAEGRSALAGNWVQLPAGSAAAIGDSYAGGCFFAPDGSLRMTPEMAAAAKEIAALQAELQAAKILLGIAE